MSVGGLCLIVLALGVVGFVLGRLRAVRCAGGDVRVLHSLPSYHGASVFLFTVVPALAVLAAWLFVQPIVQSARVTQNLEAQLAHNTAEAPENLDLVMVDVRRIAGGLDALAAQGALDDAGIEALNVRDDDIRARLAKAGVALGADVQAPVLEAAKHYRALDQRGASLRVVFVVLMCGVGLVVAYLRITPQLRARNVVETCVKALLFGCSLIAVATTFGIVVSLFSESLAFFKIYPARDFFLSLTWNPQFRGGSDLGILPLLWGTLYVSFIALVVAVPIGLMAAIYLSEYAGKRLRSFAKPIIEILAGIPTVVYGLFALITVGPFLRDYLAEPLGLGTSSSSVMTAGLVMGIMLIPFVSSLSDDIMNAVPQTMRDGSFGLGATQSETIKKVIFPAALPGIVGAVLLAASRAIGETMIVVMGAGAAAQLNLNPFEAMTTVTVKIVSQLTGDTEFASPETLVAFALGLTLFCFTLGLNVLALYIVRKYREQYE